MLAFVAPLLLLGQAPLSTPAGTEIRALTLTLLDDKAREVTDVSLQDVALTENGVHRDIEHFAPDTRPVTAAILVDTSAAVGSAYRLNVVDAVVGLVTRLPPGTRYSIWTTGDRPLKRLDYTEDKGAAGKALRLVAPQGGNYTIDALAEATEDMEKKGREGDRRVVVAVTALGPEFSYLDKQAAAEKAEDKADLFVSVEIQAGGDDLDTRSRLGYVLDRLARASGGRDDQVLTYMALESALERLSAHIASAYRLRYVTLGDLKKRKLELTVARPGTRVFIPELLTPGER
jgi:von Willebrand factor type A domain